MINYTFLLLVSVVAGASAAAENEEPGPGLYLFSIPAYSLVDSTTGSNDDRSVKLYVNNPQRVADQFEKMSVMVVAKDAGTVTVIATEKATVDGEPLKQHLAASFVVDFDEPFVSSLVEELVDQYGERPGIGKLAQFAFNAIPDKTYKRNFDLASKVARSGEGDCTEHAVLLAALARATGRPARVVLGLQLVEQAPDFSAFGHAWNEVYDNGSWHIVDSTMPANQAPDATIHYLPLFVLNNEGPGYTLDLANLAALYPSQVVFVPGT